MPSELLLLDACITLNLMATEHIEAVAAACDLRFVMADTAAAEILYLEEEVDGERHRVEVDVQPLIAAGTIRITSLDGDREESLFVDLVRDIDDGEAATLAIAIARGIAVATDDRKAAKLAAGHGARIAWTTPSLLREFALRAAITVDRSRALLHRVETRARYLPPRRDPAGQWWNHTMGRP